MNQALPYYTQHFKTPLGMLQLFATTNHLVGVFFERHQKPLPSWLATAQVQKTKLLAWATQELQDYFARKSTIFTVPIHFQGTAFQQAVWQELQTISSGELRTYSDHAHQLRQPKAVRAVGAAIGKNPLSIIVPCHRVIGQSGWLTGYAGGLETKAWLLTHEGHTIQNHKIVGRTP